VSDAIAAQHYVAVWVAARDVGKSYRQVGRIMNLAVADVVTALSDQDMSHFCCGVAEKDSNTDRSAGTYSEQAFVECTINGYYKHTLHSMFHA
jgi:hypothetical protein